MSGIKSPVRMAHVMAGAVVAAVLIACGSNEDPATAEMATGPPTNEPSRSSTMTFFASCPIGIISRS